MAEPTPRTFQIPTARTDLPLGIVCGIVFAIFLFVLMGIAPLMQTEPPPKVDLNAMQVSVPPPEVDEIEFEEPEPEVEEEPPPEMDVPPPEISLDQIALDLSPGTGGGFGGDFSIPDVAATAGKLSSDDLFNFADLDEPPKLVDRSQFNWPPALRTKPVKGMVVVYIELDENGSVTLARIARSDLPQFNDSVIQQIRTRKFSAPTVQGKPVKAKANLPIPITIQKSN